MNKLLTNTVLLATLFVMSGCSQDTSSVDRQDLPAVVHQHIADLNETLSDMSSFNEGSYIHASARKSKQSGYVLIIAGKLLTDDKSKEWSVSGSDLLIGLIAYEAYRSQLFSHMQWVMDVNGYQIEGSQTFPHEAENDYQKIVDRY